MELEVSWTKLSGQTQKFTGAVHNGTPYQYSSRAPPQLKKLQSEDPFSIAWPLAFLEEDFRASATKIGFHREMMFSIVQNRLCLIKSQL